MHDQLYQTQQQWVNLNSTERTTYFLSLASDLKLNVDTFKTDLDSEKIKQKIDFDRQLGKKANVQGTPSFFIGTKNVGDQYVKDGKIVPKGTDGAELVWSNAESFEKLVVLPALKDAGIATE
jgi:protein-disulfide isomerase